MTNHSDIINWAIDNLSSKGYFLIEQPEIIQKTPWSTVLRLSTAQGNIYLKQPVPLLANEASTIELLYYHYKASVPHILAKNSELHCFLMKDAGLTLRNYIKNEYKTKLLCKAIEHFTKLQRAVEHNVKLLLNHGLPDWRLKQIPLVYRNIIDDKEFLKTNGITDEELVKLNCLIPLVDQQLHDLTQYGISETIVQPDFNTNNILINPKTQQFTTIDLGELVISHPFFSLQNFLYQATLYHNVKERDRTWNKMLHACIENWLDLASKEKLLQAYELSTKLWPVYAACTQYHFMHCVDITALNSWYANKPNRLASILRVYLNTMRNFKIG